MSDYNDGFVVATDVPEVPRRRGEAMERMTVTVHNFMMGTDKIICAECDTYSKASMMAARARDVVRKMNLDDKVHVHQRKLKVYIAKDDE